MDTPTAASVEQLRLQFHGAPGCPSETAFLQELAARTDKFRRVTHDSAARLFVVSVRQRQNVFLGRLDVRDADRPTSRSIEGEVCSQVVSALSVMIALAVDPDANTSRIQSSPEEKPSFDIAAPARRQQAEPASPDTARPPAEESPGWALGLGLEGLVNVLSAPTAAWGPALLLNAQAPPRWPAKFDAGIAIEGLTAATFSQAWGDVQFSEFALRADLCAGSDVMSGWRVSLCPSIRFALTRAAPRGLPDARDQQVTRWDFAWSARSSWPLGRRLSLDAKGGLAVPFQRQAFMLVDPDTPVYTTRRAGVVLSVGVLLRFR